MVLSLETTCMFGARGTHMMCPHTCMIQTIPLCISIPSILQLEVAYVVGGQIMQAKHIPHKARHNATSSLVSAALHSVQSHCPRPLQSSNLLYH